MDLTDIYAVFIWCFALLIVASSFYQDDLVIMCSALAIVIVINNSNVYKLEKKLEQKYRPIIINRKV